MSETKHTPGPWTFTQSTFEPHWCDVRGTDHEELATVWNKADTHGKVALANARMIAAAPELLEACNAALVRGCANLGQLADHDDTIKLLRAALAKAEGGAR